MEKSCNDQSLHLFLFYVWIQIVQGQDNEAEARHWRGIKAQLTLKNNQVLKGAIVQIDKKGVMFDPERQSPFYDPKAEFFPFNEVKEILTENGETLYGQTIRNKKNQSKPDSKLDYAKNATTIGILQGGSLIGFDHEIRLNPNFGLQFGAGLLGFAGAVNFHFQKTTNSNFLSLAYKNFGLGYVSFLGPEFGFRWFPNESWGVSFQLGFGFFLTRSDEFRQFWRDKFNDEKAPGVLTYSLGIVF